MSALVVGLSVWTVLSLLTAAVLGCVLTGARRVEARALAAAARAAEARAAEGCSAVVPLSAPSPDGAADALPAPRASHHDVAAPAPA